MSDEEKNKDEKTEEPSAKRLKESKEKGQVPRSKDFNAMMIMVFSALSIWMMGQMISQQLALLMTNSFSFSYELSQEWAIFRVLKSLLVHVGWSLLPLLIILFMLTIISPVLMGGFVVSTENLVPKFSRLNPLAGLKRIFSVKGLFELLKSFLKFVLSAVVSFFVIRYELPKLLTLSNMDIQTGIYEGLAIFYQTMLIVSGAMVLIAMIDVPFQWHQHLTELKMTRQELKDEYKETEGSPELKGHIRRQQQAMAKRRMMSEVPKATVIVTNPTHFAVAIRYDKEGQGAPRIIAKGKDMIALHINKIAKAHAIPIICVPPLARAIYYSTKLNQEIPNGLYLAVAQVLAYVYQIKDKRYYEEKPPILQAVPIPDALKRDEEESTHG